MSIQFRFLVLLLSLLGANAFAQEIQPRFQAVRKAKVARTADLPASGVLSSSNLESGPISPCEGVPGMTYFEIDDVFSLTGRGLVASGILREGSIFLFNGPVLLYAIREDRLLELLRKYPEGHAQARVHALHDLKNNSVDNYLVTVTGIERMRKGFDGIIAGPDGYGLFLEGVTRAELTKEYVLVNYDEFILRFAMCSREPYEMRLDAFGGK